MEVRLGGPDGTLLGVTENIGVSNVDLRAETRRMVQEWEAGGKKGPRPNFWMVRELFRPKFVISAKDVEGVHESLRTGTCWLLEDVFQVSFHRIKWRACVEWQQ